jgi:hypothetical protein
MDIKVESIPNSETALKVSMEPVLSDEELARKLYEEELRFEASTINDELIAQQLQEHYDSKMAFRLQKIESKNIDKEKHFQDTPTHGI